VDERRRLVAAIVEPPAYFADSTNSIISEGSNLATLEYFLALLNSTLFQWRFKLTSTNNNVGTNELESLPIRQLRKTVATQTSAHDRLVTLVMKLAQLGKQLETARTTQRDILGRQARGLERHINGLVYQIYGLSQSDIELVERIFNSSADTTSVAIADIPVQA